MAQHNPTSTAVPRAIPHAGEQVMVQTCPRLLGDIFLVTAPFVRLCAHPHLHSFAPQPWRCPWPSSTAPASVSLPCSQRMLRGQRMINARHRKAEESEAGKCIPQAGRAGTARPEKQPQFLSAPAPSPAAEPAPAWPDPQPAPWGGCCWSQAPLHPWRSRSELLTPAGRALASTHLHKLCTSLPVGAT